VIFSPWPMKRRAVPVRTGFFEHQRECWKCRFLVYEGGENLLEAGKVKYVGVDVGEKTTFWLHVVAHGRAGHGSRPIADPPNRLVRALDRILAYVPRSGFCPWGMSSWRDMAALRAPQRKLSSTSIQKALEDKKFQDEIEKDESLNFCARHHLTHHDGGSDQTNVIRRKPGEPGFVRPDCRGRSEAVLEAIRRVANDSPNVTIEPLNAEFRVANYSPTKTGAVRCDRQVSRHYFRERRWFPVSPADIREPALSALVSMLTASRLMP